MKKSSVLKCIFAAALVFGAGECFAQVSSGAANSSQTKISISVKPNQKKTCEGKWIFENGECVTTLLCNSDGSMYFRIDKGNDIKLWKGSYKATKKDFQFHSMLYKERINGKDSSSSVEETWFVEFKNDDGRELRINSATMPQDMNGYNFSNTTIFHAAQ